MKKYKFAVNQIYEIPANSQEEATDIFLNADNWMREDHMVDDDWACEGEVT